MLVKCCCTTSSPLVCMCVHLRALTVEDFVQLPFEICYTEVFHRSADAHIGRKIYMQVVLGNIYCKTHDTEPAGTNPLIILCMSKYCLYGNLTRSVTGAMQPNIARIQKFISIVVKILKIPDISS